MRLRCLWEVFRDLGFVLWPLRLIALPLIVCCGALIALPQAQEILVKLGQDNKLIDWLFFAVAAAWLAINAWYWSRFITGFLTTLPFNRMPLERCGSAAYGGTPLFGGQSARIKFLVAHLPRVMGFATLIAIAAALYKASTLLPLSDSAAREHLTIAYTSVGISAFVFYGLVWSRRSVAVALRYAARIGHLAAAIPPAPPMLTSIRDLPLLLGLSAIISVALFIASWTAPVTTAAVLGPPAILFLAATAWIAFGTLLVYAGQATGLPIIGAIVAISFFSSLFPDRGIFRDNHDVRPLAQVPKDRTGTQERITPYFEAWAGKPGPETSTDAGRPVIIVATAGGGIRAAYWTATVLGQLSDRSEKNARARVSNSPNLAIPFSKDLFAISGVSGGSLGAAVYRALLIERARGATTCRLNGASQAFSFAGCGQAALSGDFLGPTLAAALFPDLAQRFLPIKIFPDRAQALEEAWETSWRAAMGSDRLSGDFLSDGGIGELPLPALLLNGTSVANGWRLVTSNIPLSIAWSNGDVRPVLPEIMDFFADSETTVRLSTAVNNSARFSWVGPAGTIRKADGGIADRIVDGGYFENFGATTAIDLINWLNGQTGEDKVGGPGGRKLITILISSDPDLYDADATNCGTKPGAPADSSERGREVLTPIITLMETREARGSYAADQLERMTRSEQGEFFHFRLLKQTDVRDAPLGWTLSERAQDAIRNSWLACQNSETMQGLARELHWTQ